MPFYADLHIHSKHSRATSRDCDLEHLAWWGQRKGVGVVATGDFTHPAWFSELQDKLVPAEPGLFRLRSDLEREVASRLPSACVQPVRFMLSVEISTIYKKDEHTRKIHHLVYAPDFDTAGRFRTSLGRIGNIASDGRPILGLDSRHLLEIALESGHGAYLVPAHIWTPWFSVLGSKSGFDAVEACYGDLADHIFAVETGLSSDPPMNWRVSQLDRYRLVSNSDAHSPPMLGREACVFDIEPDYYAIREALESGRGYGGTIEFFPEEGKYHLDGHRKCGVRLAPDETRRLDGLCPTCGKPVTVGVMHRVETLADRADGERPAHADPFRSIVALPQIVGELHGVGAKSKRVAKDIGALVDRLGPELEILERVPLEDIRGIGSSLLTEAIERLRAGKVIRDAGYDGEYGVIRMFEARELHRAPMVATLFDDLPMPDDIAPTSTTEAPRATGPTPAASPQSAPASPSSEPPRGSDCRFPLLQPLDPEQRRAAEIVEGALLIIAGPGTGKTRTLVHRMAHLVEDCGVDPQQCLAITFTRRAAGEMRSRLRSLTRAASRMNVTTFHGFGMRLVREHHSALGLHRSLRIAEPGERLEIAREITGLSSRESRRLLEDVDRAQRGSGSTPKGMHRAYRERLWDHDLLDFNDLIALPVELLEGDPGLREHYRRRFPWVSVDEYQDVDALQYRLLRLLVAEDGNLCAIGDPDQAIYGFRGADVGFFLRFREDFAHAETVRLQRNYRSSPTIVAGALQAIRPTSLVPDRSLESTAQGPGAQIAVHEATNEHQEAAFVVHAIEKLIGGYSHYSLDSGRVGSNDGETLSFADIAILYRTDAQCGPLVEALSQSGIPFQKRSHDRLIDRPLVASLAHTLRRLDPVDAPLAEQVRRATEEIREPASKTELGDVLDLLSPLLDREDLQLDGFLSELDLGAEVDTWDPRADRTSLLTMHAAKGLEFPVVFVVGCEEGLVPLRWGIELDEQTVAEERRLFFVSMTRAQSHLLLSHARQRNVRGATRARRRSAFLNDIHEALLERSRAAARPARPAVPRAEQLALI